MADCRFLIINGVVSQTSEVPPVSSLLETHPGAYTTTRTHRNASYPMFWERHLRRLADSTKILAESRPEFLFGSQKTETRVCSSSSWESVIRPLVNDSLRRVLLIAEKERSSGEELAITALVSGNLNNLNESEEDRDHQGGTFRDLDVYVHVGVFVPPVFGIRGNGLNLAVVGRGRDVARAKFSEWVRLRKKLERLRPPSTNELLLSNDGDRILEGCVTNFFVVCRKENSDAQGESPHDLKSSYVVRTASISDGVLPGVMRQLVIEACLTKGIPFQEVAPAWSKCELWEEAFTTNSLRLMQHVETIRFPSSWEQLELKTWKEVSWEEKRFKEGPGIITAEIQREIMKRADLEGCSVSDFT